MSGPEKSASVGAILSEVTPKALVLGVLIGLVMGMANVYLGLFAGMTVSASIPAAVISMGLLRSLFKNVTILENNIVQTIASAGESLAAGVIFTMPALVIAGVWSEFDFWVTTLVAMTGGLLGVLFMIPLRKPMIVDDDELVYPEGVACSQVLSAGEEGGSRMKAIFAGLGVGALIQVGVQVLGFIGDSLSRTVPLGKVNLYLGLTAAPALIGVGYIVGINIAMLVFMGGAIAWLGSAPVMVLMDYEGLGSMEAADAYGVLKENMRYLGVGAMVVGGLWSILMIRKGIAQGVRETLAGYKKSMGASAPVERTEKDMESRWVLLLLAATSVIILLLYNHLTGGIGVSALATVLMVICSFFFVAVAAYIVGLVGSSNSPVSGMTICSVLFTSGFIALFGFSGEVAILATLGVAGVVCCATCTSGDVCQDLKTGHLVGATPYRQQWVEVIGVVTASFVMYPALALLHSSRGIATDAHLSESLQGRPLEAPQAQLFASLMDGFFGDATLEWGLVIAGAAIGAGIIAIDQLVLRPQNARFRMHVMPVAVGMYLPFGLSTAILVGGLLAWMGTRGAQGEAEAERRKAGGILIASGLIAGEAISNVGIAVPLALEIPMPEGMEEGVLKTVFTILMVVGVSIWLLRSSKKSA